MASIRKTAYRTWQVRFRDPAGRQRGKTFKRKADADAFRARVEHTLRTGEFVDPSHGRVRFSEWAWRWLDGQIHLRPASVRRYASMLRNHLIPCFGGLPLTRVAPSHVRAWVGSLSATHAPYTVRHIFSLLNTILDAAVFDGLLARNPCARTPLPEKKPAHPRSYLTPEEVERIVDSITRRYEAFVILGAYTGLRWGEIAGLHLNDIDFLGRKLSVTRAVAQDGGRHYLAEPKTAASRRTIAVPSSVVEVLSRHVREFPSESGFVFTGARGGMMRYPDFYRFHWRPATHRAGLPEAKFHELRHSHASWLISAGQSVKVIQERLGHSSASTTLDTYAHLMDGMDGQAALLLDETYRLSQRK